MVFLHWGGTGNSLQWLHNERSCISNHLCLNCLFRRRSKKTSKLCITGLDEGNSLVTGEFPSQWPVMQKMFPFDDIIMWNPSSSWTRISVSCLVNHMAADDLAGGQGSSSHGIGWVSLDYSGFNTRALSQHKDHLSWNGYFNYKDKMVMRPSYLYKGNPILVRQHLYIEMVPWGACY